MAHAAKSDIVQLSGFMDFLPTDLHKYSQKISIHTILTKNQHSFLCICAFHKGLRILGHNFIILYSSHN